MKKRLWFVTELQIWGCLLVIFGHSFPLDIIVPEPLNTIQAYIYTFHMPLFIIASGYLFSYTNSIRIKGYKKFIKEKFWRLMLPYFTFGLLAYLPKVLMVSYLNDKLELDIKSFVRSFLYPRGHVWGHFWFIPTLFILFLIAPVLSKAMGNLYSKWILVLLALIGYFGTFNIGFLGFKDVIHYMIFFIIGMLAVEVELDLLVKMKARIIVFVSMAIMTGIYIFIDLSGLLSQIINLGVCLTVIIMLVSLSINCNEERIGYYGLFGRNTFLIFMLSWPFQIVVEVLLNRVFGLNYYLICMVMFIFGIAGPLTVIYIIDRLETNRLIRLARKIIGI